MNDPPKASRRRFLEVVGGATLASSVGCSAGGVGPDPIGEVTAGNIADLPVGELRLVDTLPVCIGRDDLGVYAMTLTCPHAGCNMATQGSVSFDGVFCACHGSRFTRDGDVSQGPAHDSLVHFAVSIDVDGNLTIHGGQEVSRGTRMAVPA